MTTTPNPTAEPLKSWEVDNEAWEAFSAEEHLTNGIQAAYEAGLRAQSRLSEGTPSEEQVERAAEALARREPMRSATEWENLHEFERSGFRESARAALEAAAGVAPQAESVPTSKYISPHLPSMIRNLWKSDPSENSVRTALKLAGDLIQELIDLRAASVQPSSTVDEAALIREAKAEAWDEAEGEIHKWYATYKATLFTAPENPYREGSET